MCAPTCNSGNCKKRRVQFAGNAQHAVYKSRIEIDVGADSLFAAMELAENFRSKALDDVVKVEFFKAILFLCKFCSLVAKENCTRIADCINSVSLTVNQARAVKGFLASDLSKIFTVFVFVCPVLNIALDVVHHFHYADVCSTMAASLEGTYGCGNCRICIGVGRRNYVDCK